MFDEYYKDLPMPRRAYARMISTTDHQVGLILHLLDGLGLTDDTIIVFMSDNGHSTEEFRIRPDGHASGLPKGHNYGANGGGGNTGQWRGAKGSFYEGGVRVPAMIRCPREIDAGLVRDQAVTALDIMPTVLEYCGIDPPAGVAFDGRPLLPIIHDNAPSQHNLLHWQWQNRWAVREGDWKLIGRGGDALELVNLADEKPEQKNHLADRPAIAERLLTKHRAWVSEVTP